MGFFAWNILTIIMILYYEPISCQPPPAGGVVAAGGAGAAGNAAGGAAGGAGGGPPPGRGFQLRCTDEYAYEDQTDQNIKQQFAHNAHPDYEVESVEPCIYPGKNAHRFLVKYSSRRYRRCEDIQNVYDDMNNYKPQNSNVGSIAVVPGGYLVEYKKYCRCYRRSYRRRRWIQHRAHSWDDAFPSGYFMSSPTVGFDGNVRRCDDRDKSCGYQSF